MKTPIYISILLVFLLFSCTKFGRNVTIKGKVINPVTQEPIEGVEAWFQKTTIGLPGGYKTIKEEITDANGEFEINAGRIGTHYIRLGDVKGNYRLGWYENGEYNGTSVKEVDKGKVMEVEYHLVPYGELQINIKNTNCFNQNDTLRILRSHSIPSFYDGVPNPAVYEGCVDNIGNMNKSLMGWYKYKGKVIRNGSELPIKDSIYLEAGETEVWNIFY